MDKTEGIGTTSTAWLGSKSSIAPPKLQPHFDFVIIIDWLRARQILENFLFHLQRDNDLEKNREHETKNGSRTRVSGALARLRDTSGCHTIHDFVSGSLKNCFFSEKAYHDIM